MPENTAPPVALVEEAFEFLAGAPLQAHREQVLQLALQLIQSGDRSLPSADPVEDAAAGIAACVQWHERVTEQHAKLVVDARHWLDGCEEGELAHDYDAALGGIAGILVPALPRSSADGWIEELLQLIFEGVAPSSHLSSLWPRDQERQHANPYRFVVSMRAAVQAMEQTATLTDVHEPAVRTALKTMRGAARAYLKAVYKDDGARGDRAGTAKGVTRGKFVVRFYEALEKHLGHHGQISARALQIAAMRMGESLGFEDRRHQAGADDHRADAMRRRLKRFRP